MNSRSGSELLNEKRGGKQPDIINFIIICIFSHINHFNRYIPRIKSHCAEERTLDLCVQRLRKKIMVESWEARHSSSQQMLQPSQGNGTVSLNQRTPSFFQSPSLVCLGGLTVLDPYESVHTTDETNHQSTDHDNHQISEHVDVCSGWGGMGLRGNHSFTNLHRSASDGSGVFIGDDSETEQDDTEPRMSKNGSNGSWPSKVGASENYIKTSHMANFYYRKSASQADLDDGQS